MMEFANNLTRAAQPIDRNRGQPSTKILLLEAQTKGLIFGKIKWKRQKLSSGEKMENDDLFVFKIFYGFAARVT